MQGSFLMCHELLDKKVSCLLSEEVQMFHELIFWSLTTADAAAVSAQIDNWGIAHYDNVSRYSEVFVVQA